MRSVKQLLLSVRLLPAGYSHLLQQFPYIGSVQARGFQTGCADKMFPQRNEQIKDHKKSLRQDDMWTQRTLVLCNIVHEINFPLGPEKNLRERKKQHAMLHHLN